MESAAFVVQRLPTLADTLFTRAKSTKVFRSLGSFFEKTQDDPALVTTIDFDVEEDFVFDLLPSKKKVETIVSECHLTVYYGVQQDWISYKATSFRISSVRTVHSKTNHFKPPFQIEICTVVAGCLPEVIS